MTDLLQHALALLENGWTVRLGLPGVGGLIEWRSPRGVSRDSYRSSSLDCPPDAVIKDAVANGDYFVQAKAV